MWWTRSCSIIAVTLIAGGIEAVAQGALTKKLEQSFVECIDLDKKIYDPMRMNNAQRLDSFSWCMAARGLEFSKSPGPACQEPMVAPYCYKPITQP